MAVCTASGPTTVTVTDAAGIFRPWAVMTAVPGVSPETLIAKVVNSLPSGKKFTEACTWATAGLLDVSDTDTPPSTGQGAEADSFSNKICWLP